MMSAALSVLAGVEQTGKSAGSPDPFIDLSVDPGKPEGMSFAKSFSDRIGQPGLLQEKSSAKEASIGVPPGPKTAILAKKLNAGVATSGEENEVNHSVQKIAAQGKAKSTSTFLGRVTQSLALTGSEAKTVMNGSAAKNVAPAVEEDETTNDAPSGSPGLEAVPVVLRPKGDVVVPAGPTEEGWSSVPGTGSAFAPKQTESTGKMKETSSTKKPAKMAENTSTSKILQKTVGIVGNGMSKAAEASLREDAGTVSQGGIPGVAAPPKDVRTTNNLRGEAVLGKMPSLSGVPSWVAGVVVHKEVGHEGKAVAEDAEKATISSDDQPALPKFGEELNKCVTSTASPGNGGDSKMQSAFGSTAMAVHSVAGSMAAGTAPIAVAGGSTPAGDPVSMKPQTGDAGGHAAGLMGSRDQGGLGVIATPNDAIPTMLKATPTTLEVGIQDGTHGWLKVRAEMADGGVVNASVSAASSTGQEMLHRELPAITSYLQQEKIAVNAIAIHAPLAAAGGEQRSSTGMHSAGGQTPQGGHDGGDPRQRKEITAGPEEVLLYRSLHEVDEDGLLPLATYASGGSWLSVRA